MNPILVVDDDESYRELLVLTLEDRCGAGQVLGFSCAAALLRHLSGPREPPALVLLDYHMPEATGLELMGRIRAHEPQVPIAFLSGAAADGEREACLAAGACASLRKPVAYPELIRMLQTLIESVSTAPQAGASSRDAR